MPPRKKHLPRLEEGFYTGRSFIHWTHTINQRATGWLSPKYHQAFRELLIHTSGRYKVAFPVFCLMPDHLHLLAVGLRDESNQRNATRFLRKELNRLLAPNFKLQRQAYDHVLPEADRERDAFEAIAFYISNNPVRAGLCAENESYPFVGGIFAGYPDLDFDSPDYWDCFWKVHQHDQKLGKDISS